MGNKLREAMIELAGHLHLTKAHKVDLRLLKYYIRLSFPKLTGEFHLLRIGLIIFLLGMTLTGLWPPFSNAQIQFEDISEAAGVLSWGDSFGASWGDYNSDGWPDLWLGNHCETPALYRNNSDGTFTAVTDIVKNYNAFEQHGAAWADFDNDGDQDLIQIVGGDRQNSNQPNQFFINAGGLLQNKAADYGLDYPMGRGRTPLWLDWNQDGYLDVFVSNMNRTDGKEAPSALFTRKGDYFRNDTGAMLKAGLSSDFAQLFIPTFMASPAIVIQGYPFPKRDSYPERIYQFTAVPFPDVTDSIGFPIIKDVFDAAIADFNNDLLNDFFLVTDPEHLNEKVWDRLLIQTKKGFLDITEAAGLGIPTSCRSVAAADFDNDMDVDLYLVCNLGDCNIPNVLYENLANGTFRAVTAAGGAEGSSYGTGDTVSIADFNNDGFQDLFVTNQRTYNGENGHNQLFRNVGNSNHWIEIKLEGVVSNRDGIGTLILASSGGKTQMRVQGGGVHRISQDDQRVHFGLAANTSVDKLTIQWPSGILQEIHNIPANQILNVVELDIVGSVISGVPPLPVIFASNARGFYKPVRYKWDFDNDGVIDSTDQHPSYTYKNRGIYTVTLEVTDRDGRRITSMRNDYITLRTQR